MEPRKGIIMSATIANTSSSVLDIVRVNGLRVELRRITEHNTRGTSYVISAYRSDGTVSDSNFSGYAQARSIFDSLTSR